jgi:hypothetical protein
MNSMQLGSILTRSVVSVATTMIVGFGSPALAGTINLNFTKLNGLAGSGYTAIYRADLSGLGFDLQSLTIQDGSFGLGGATGQYSGFDLDAIRLSRTLIDDASSVTYLSGLDVLDFSPSRTLFSPGTQRSPEDAPNLFGSIGTTVNQGLATLNSFDAVFDFWEGWQGFLSLGDGGRISFDLTSAVETVNPLYLYLAEVGDNGELAAGSIVASSSPVITPEPETPQSTPEPSLFLGFTLLGLWASSKCQRPQTVESAKHH